MIKDETSQREEREGKDEGEKCSARRKEEGEDAIGSNCQYWPNRRRFALSSLVSTATLYRAIAALLDASRLTYRHKKM